MRFLMRNTKPNTVWDLNVLYQGTNDPHIERDIQTFENQVIAFEKKHRSETKRCTEPSYVRSALDGLEAIGANAESARAGYYFGLRRELDAHDDSAEKRLNVLGERLTKISNRLLFFEIALGKIPKKSQERLLADRSLAKYHYHLKLIFEHAQHTLSEPEEKILSLKSNTSRSLWISGTDKILNRKVITFKDKKLPFSEAVEQVSELAVKDRNALWKLITGVLRDMGEITENELTAIVLDKKVSDELRGYKEPYSATVRGYENSEKAILALVEVVKKNYHVAHRFYALKARILGMKRLSYVDRNASVGAEAKISFKNATATLAGVFERVNPEYRTILERMLNHGQIDAFPKKGKTGGAFCASQTHLPTYVLLNYIPKMRSVMTYAHEMGHAIHAERTKVVQPPHYQGHSTSVAETASTLFENFMFDATLEKLSRKERIVALHNRIQDDIATIMRQVAFFEFEREMHATVRNEGAMNHEELSALMQKHLSAYLGKHVSVTKDDGYTYVYVSHFRNFFYVYTYVYGLLVSGAIASRFKADSNYRKEIDTFLTDGCSRSPEEIFKNIGIDTTKPEFFTAGLSRLNERISELETLCKQEGILRKK
jgi:oligoendopeptidase F